MEKGPKSKCNSTSHKLMKDKAKNRVEDLQEMLAGLQSARKESRSSDIALLEEQVHQMLHEWKAELNAPSPASSLHGGSIGSFSDIGRLLQLSEEEDDATSHLKEPVMPKPQPGIHIFPSNDLSVEDYLVNNGQQDNDFPGFDQCKGFPLEFCHLDTQIDNKQFGPHPDFGHGLFTGADCSEQCVQESMPHILPNICPPPSAFLGPKCALWDCPRPALGSEWWQDYCSSFHATLALSEGPPGKTPVLRPLGIGLKDGPLFAALNAKTLGKDVGIPECEGAATAKSPWNAPELFDLALLEGETIREWLFFDRPRRAFESGNRKQRSLPDYSGRGWHESRKQVMKEYGGQKRSYYMDPQPVGCFEWHLYEYEIYASDACALYRLELKFVDGSTPPKGKKSPKGRVTNDSLADLQKKMGRLTAEVPPDSGSSGEIKMKTNRKEDSRVGDSVQAEATAAKTMVFGDGDPNNGVVLL